MTITLTERELEVMRSLWDLSRDAHMAHSMVEGKIRDLQAQAELLWRECKLADVSLRAHLRDVVEARGGNIGQPWRIDIVNGVLLEDGDDPSGVDPPTKGDVN